MAPIDKVVGGYKLKDEITRGCFGVLYSATAQNTQRCLVQKIFDVTHSVKLDDRLREIKQISSCPYLLNIWDYFFHPRKNKLFVVMQECDEITLQDYIEKQPKRNKEEKLSMMSDITKGLIYLHEKSIIHGDIAPSHILLVTVRGKKHCKIGNLIESRLNRGKQHGNTLYQAPEVLEWRPMSTASDVFSAGLVFLSMWGQYGVQERESIVWMLRGGQAADALVEDIVPDNPDLVKMLVRMLQWESEERPSASYVERKYLKHKCANQNETFQEIGDNALDPGESCVKFDAVDVTHELEATVRSKWFLAEHRLRSFDRWPDWESLRRLNPERMVEAGFYATGKGDEVRCASCRLRLAQWEVNDDPWREHRDNSPRCPLILQKADWKIKQNVFCETHDSTGAIAEEPQHEILKELGRGGYGTVYKVRLLETNEVVALKEVKLKKNHIPEMRIAKELIPHPNIVSMHDSFVAMKGNETYTKAFIHIFMEYSPKGNLNDFMVEKEVGLPESMGFMLDIAKGIEHLHKSKIMHRDLKPDNILVFLPAARGERYYGKVSDFGVSNFLAGDKGLTSRMPRHPFQAPEVLDMLTKENYSTERDVYSVGAICYALAALIIEDDCLKPFLGKHGIGTAVLRSNDIYEDIKPCFRRNDRLAKVVSLMLLEDSGKRPKIRKISTELENICAEDDIYSIEFGGKATRGDSDRDKRRREEERLKSKQTPKTETEYPTDGKETPKKATKAAMKTKVEEGRKKIPPQRSYSSAPQLASRGSKPKQTNKKLPK